MKIIHLLTKNIFARWAKEETNIEILLTHFKKARHRNKLWGEQENIARVTYFKKGKGKQYYYYHCHYYYQYYYFAYLSLELITLFLWGKKNTSYDSPSFWLSPIQSYTERAPSLWWKKLRTALIIIQWRLQVFGKTDLLSIGECHKDLTFFWTGTTHLAFFAI